MVIETNVPTERLLNMVSGAMEGSSSYWLHVVELRLATGVTKADVSPARGESPQGKLHAEIAGDGEYYPSFQVIPFVEGCSLLIDTNEKDEINGATQWLLNLEAIAKGIQVMSEKYPNQYTDMIDENDDADTHDTFMQCCLFGEVVFG